MTLSTNIIQKGIKSSNGLDPTTYRQQSICLVDTDHDQKNTLFVRVRSGSSTVDEAGSAGRSTERCNKGHNVTVTD